MTATYSAFFASGLLAPSHLYSKACSPPSSPGLLPSSPGFMPSSPGIARSSSPVLMGDDSDVEDLSITMDVDETRAPTPTATNVGGRSRSGSVASTVHQGERPRLRKRRSSLNIATSPMNSIKSPHRTAGNALYLQQRLPVLPTGSVGRSRSGSLSFLGFGVASTAEPSDSPTMVSQTNLLGRMRSGSVGGSTFSNIFRPRRAVRRLVSVPAPAPPPTAPLPALPAEASKHTKSKSKSLFRNSSMFSGHKAIISHGVNNRPPLAQLMTSHEPLTPPIEPKGRTRAYSYTKGLTVDTWVEGGAK